MTGTPSQTEWAERIKLQVGAEFDRVAMALQMAAGKQRQEDQAGTAAVIAILQEKRLEVLAKNQAGYFIRDWQELRDQVSQLIAQDPRYQAIRAEKSARKRS